MPWAYFYDEEGSRLFEAICELPEYYLTRTEDAILRRHAEEMVDGLAAGGETGLEPTIIELGSGSAVKTQRLIAAGLRQPWPAPLCADRRFSLRARGLGPAADAAVPELKVTGYVADYRRGSGTDHGPGQGPSADRLPGLEPGQL